MSFDQTVAKIADPYHKLTQLLRLTKGEALHAIVGCAIIGGQKGYDSAREILESRFGDKVKVSHRIMEHLTRDVPVKTSQELQSLADDLVTADLSFYSMGKTYDYQELISKIVSRLSRYYKDRWRKRALDHKETKGDYPDFKGFVKFLSREALDANDPVYSFNPTQNTQKKKVKGISLTVAGKQNRTFKNHQCPCCHGPHRLYMCELFKDSDIGSRLDFVKTNKLCYNCLLSNHVVSDCKSPVCCRHCQKRHNSLLHEFQNAQGAHQLATGSTSVQGTKGVCKCKVKESVNVENADSVGVVASSNLNASAVEFTYVSNNCVNNAIHVKGILLPLVAVTVNGNVDTVALLDPASTHSFVKKSLLDKLSVKGTKTKLNLSTMNHASETKTHFFRLKVQGHEGHTIYLNRAHQVEDIPVPNVTLWGNYSHLSGLAVPDPSDVTLLIGQDCSEALIPYEVRKGLPNEPYAVRTILGWCISGPVWESESECTNQTVISMCMSAEQLDIHALWEDDNEVWPVEGNPVSLDDKYMLKLWEDNLNIVNGKFELPIPWKKDGPQLPNNYTSAHRRLESLIRRLRRDELYDQYDAQIQRLLDEGYAEYVPDNEIGLTDGSVWYFPHHHVRKKNEKIRIVHDWAFKVNGVLA